jgi:hypothetical protein
LARLSSGKPSIIGRLSRNGIFKPKFCPNECMAENAKMITIAKKFFISFSGNNDSVTD